MANANVTMLNVTVMSTSISPQISQKILACLRDKVHRNILCINTFPSKDLLNEICRTLLQVAAVEFLGMLVCHFINYFSKISGPSTTWSGLNEEKNFKNLEAVVTTTWKLFKDAAWGLIHETYNLRPDIQDEQPDAELIIKQITIPPLLEDAVWLHRFDNVCPPYPPEFFYSHISSLERNCYLLRTSCPHLSVTEHCLARWPSPPPQQYY